MLKHYDENPTRASRANQIWHILTAKAFNRQTMTYKELATILDYDGAGVFSQILGHIMFFCMDNKLPPLTSLVVNEKTGEPGDGLIVEEVLKNREKVYNYHWYRLQAPTADELNEALKKNL
jgi:hypothetical protein